MKFFIALILFGLTCRADLEMEVGSQRVLKPAAGSSILVSNPKAAKVILQNGSITVIAKQPGLAEVRVGNKIIKLTVYSSAISTERQTLQGWIKSVYGIKLKTLPDKLILEGEAHRIQDWLAIQKFKKAYGKRFSSEVTPALELLPELKSAVSQALKERSLFSAQPKVQHGEVELVTFTKDKEQLQALNTLAEDWGVSLPATSQAVELKPMIEIEIVIAEMKKNSMETIGLQLPGTYSSTIIPAGDLSSVSNTFEGMTPQLHAFFADGTNKVLANPKLLCRSGSSAHFVAGGEIPIKLVNWKTSDVIWKRYGVILDITPLADLNQGISTQIATEISLIDEAHTVDHIPGFLTNRIETHFDLRGSKTIALSGLIKSEIGRGTTGTPLLSQIPILGELFKSKDYRDNRTELVVFVTPRVISPENPPTVKVPNFWSTDDL